MENHGKIMEDHGKNDTEGVSQYTLLGCGEQQKLCLSVPFFGSLKLHCNSGIKFGHTCVDKASSKNTGDKLSNNRQWLLLSSYYIQA